ncbi:D-alanine--D-alanine ligase [Candidatus Woesebacteria bacterium]|nr:D-alanine--D-alanine ligase [Candidatus Woesebacteria bacterium]|tara:strand:+ start:368 stop:1288 length:921 start_codon:yes stop_codon:yes gene_type:complete
MKKDKINVAVLMGGKTAEHDISMLSGKEVLKNLSEKYRGFPVIISRNGQGWQELLSNKNKIDIVFIAMHGPYGEDGTVQGMLELAGIKYTGSRVLASALGMDKIAFRKLMKAVAIQTPRHVELKKGERTTKVGKPPYFVKPYDQGSSVGVSIVRKKSGLAKSLKAAWKYSDVALVEEFIPGTEVTCALLGNEDSIPLPVVEIIPSGEFFDYKSKYTDKKTQEIFPARISNTTTKRIQEIAVKVHQTLGCRGFSRVDFILRNGKTPVVLEINTIPGLTSMSLLPKAAAAAGMSYPQLLDRIVQYATN